jgi:hypothetical protein
LQRLGVIPIPLDGHGKANSTPHGLTGPMFTRRMSVGSRSDIFFAKCGINSGLHGSSSSVSPNQQLTPPRTEEREISHGKPTPTWKRPIVLNELLATSGNRDRCDPSQTPSQLFYFIPASRGNMETYKARSRRLGRISRDCASRQKPTNQTCICAISGVNLHGQGSVPFGFRLGIDSEDHIRWNL